MEQYVVPLIQKMLQENEVGETYRGFLREWPRAERPLLVHYQGPISRCRIDGPSYSVNRQHFPMGALIESPGVTAHLNPVEAREINERMQDAIERVILDWIAEHDLHSLRRIPSAVDRSTADPQAIKFIQDWMSRHTTIKALRESCPND